MKTETISVPAIELNGLTKHFSDVTAVDSVNLKVQAGEIYGFLGRNGAGKTTTIRMLLGLIKPDKGSARLFGRDVQEDRSGAVRQVGSLVETATAYPTLTTYENLDIQRRLLGTDKSEIRRVMEILKITEFSGKRAGRLSLGNKQRLALARALLGNPRLLVLDEPANALDPAGIVEIRGLLRNLAAEQGLTVFVSSHILGEISQLADRIGIIHRGKLIEEFSVAERNASDRPVSYRIQTDDADRALGMVKEVPGVDNAESNGKPGWLTAYGSSVDPSGVARILVEAGLELRALIPVYDDLESHFLKLTGGAE